MKEENIKMNLAYLELLIFLSNFLSSTWLWLPFDILIPIQFQGWLGDMILVADADDMVVCLRNENVFLSLFDVKNEKSFSFALMAM